MDEPYHGKRGFRYEAYKKVFNPGNDNAMKVGCTALLAKPKIKEAMVEYQKYMLANTKVQVTQENIEVLKRRAFYTVKEFYEKDGTPKPLDKINPEFLCCIDSVDLDYKGAQAQQKIIKYKLCNRDVAQKSLNELLGIADSMKTISMQANIPVAKDSKGTDNRPRISMNITVGGVV